MPRSVDGHYVPFELRFMKYVFFEPNCGCWLWGGSDDGNAGYGRFTSTEYGTRQAHRASYMHFVGPIADGMEIDHTCKVPACVNPKHLEQVTRQENMRRASKIGLTFGGKANGKRQRAKTHCPKGHSYENAIVNKFGWRTCRPCFYAKERARVARQSSAAHQHASQE